MQPRLISNKKWQPPGQTGPATKHWPMQSKVAQPATKPLPTRCALHPSWHCHLQLFEPGLKEIFGGQCEQKETTTRLQQLLLFSILLTNQGQNGFYANPADCPLIWRTLQGVSLAVSLHYTCSINPQLGRPPMHGPAFLLPPSLPPHLFGSLVF